MKSKEIRNRFLGFFEKHDHTVVVSSPLIPANDPTLLFANAGMNQFKDVFLGRDEQTFKRATSSQKCVRAGGKHNDLDVVGHTRRHQTFFEMLGNFSFGDYFKKEAIEFAWQLLTEEFSLPKNQLWVTVFREDQEAKNLWENHIGLPPDRVVLMDEKENFWQMGETGPCGPCSELHFDFGSNASKKRHENCQFPCECGRYIEIWNLVFMQYDRDKNGDLQPLPAPSIDTGMGLERIAAVLQGKISNYETDLFRPLINQAVNHFNVEYGKSETTDVALRIVADHARAATFLINDGIIPSNEGRGYVLRKIMRRGMRQGAILGRNEPFLHSMTGHVIELMRTAYPDLLSNQQYIAQVVENEERRFSETVSVAISKLEDISAQLIAKNKKVIPGAEIFKLYDSFGLPIDFTEEIAKEKSLRLDIKGFNIELEEQRKRTRESWKGNESSNIPLYDQFLKIQTSIFLGYEGTQSLSSVVAILGSDSLNESVEGSGTKADIILNQTPFYPESGGQVGDIGILASPLGVARVLNTYSPMAGLILHEIELDSGKISTGDEVTAQVDAARRKKIAANHTGTHLLHAILRQMLGIHVKQAGSLVAPDRLRFDYTHYTSLSDEEIKEIEERINAVILENQQVETKEMELNEAIESGAIAFFGEKYQQRVRVVSIPNISMELCGGIHTVMTGDVGLFKIVSEMSVAAGVRRLEALTGFGTYQRLQEDESLLETLTNRVRSSRADLTSGIERILQRQKQLEDEIDQLKRKDAISGLQDIVDTQTMVGNVQVIAQQVEGLNASLMRELAERVRDVMGSGIVVLGSNSDGKAMLVAVISSDLSKSFHAGNIIKQIAKLVGGSGGGRSDFAQAGGKKPEKLDQALQSVYNIVEAIGS